MKLFALQLFATTLPVMLNLVQHTPFANAVALCGPRGNCLEPRDYPAPAAYYDCPPYSGNEPGGHHSEPEHKPTLTPTPTITVTSTLTVPSTSSAPITETGGKSSTTVPTTTVSVSAVPTGKNVCDTGPIQCCNSVVPSSSKDATSLLGLLGVVLQGLTVDVGINCLPINILGIGSGSACSGQTVCCENNTFGGLINIACVPINIQL